MSDIRRLIGSRVRSLRNERGLSQGELGSKAQLHATYVGAVERGEKNVSIDSLERISKGLSVDLGSILNHLTGPEDEDTMRAFIAMEIMNIPPGIVKVIFELLAGRESADKMRAFVVKEIKHCSPAVVKVVFDLLKNSKDVDRQPSRRTRRKKV